MPGRKVKCTYREGNRRCPFEGLGEPPLCKAHQVAVQEAARPRRPSEVLAEAAVNFLQGKPINQSATIGAVDQFINQWATGMGADWRPDVNPGESEDSVHRRARPGAAPSSGWWQRRQQAPGAASEQVPPQLVMAARRVMGFGAMEVLTPDMIKARHRALVRQFHPDLAAGDAAKAKAMTEKMAAINRSADILTESLRHQ